MRAVIGAGFAAVAMAVGLFMFGGFANEETTTDVAMNDSAVAVEPVAQTQPRTEFIASAQAATATVPGDATGVQPADAQVPVAEVVLASATHATPMDGAASGEREPILCAFWAIQKFGERVGIIEASDRQISQDAYPVPAPIWVMNAIWNLGESQGA